MRRVSGNHLYYTIERFYFYRLNRIDVMTVLLRFLDGNPGNGGLRPKNNISGEPLDRQDVGVARPVRTRFDKPRRLEQCTDIRRKDIVLFTCKTVGL